MFLATSGLRAFLCLCEGGNWKIHASPQPVANWMCGVVGCTRRANHVPSADTKCGVAGRPAHPRVRFAMSLGLCRIMFWANQGHDALSFMLNLVQVVLLHSASSWIPCRLQEVRPRSFRLGASISWHHDCRALCVSPDRRCW